MEISPDRVKAARWAAGLTQSQVANAAHVSEGTYRRLENGRGSCSATTLARLAQALGCSMEDLFGADEVPA